MRISLRDDFDAEQVRTAARKSKNGGQTRRLLAVAAIYEGASRTEAARQGGVTLQIVRDWVLKFNASGPDGLIDRKAPGPRPLLSDVHRAALVEAIEAGPDESVHGVVRWRLVDLIKLLNGDCVEFCAVPFVQAIGKRSSNMMASWDLTACHSRTERFHSVEVALSAR